MAAMRELKLLAPRPLVLPAKIEKLCCHLSTTYCVRAQTERGRQPLVSAVDIISVVEKSRPKVSTIKLSHWLLHDQIKHMVARGSIDDLKDEVCFPADCIEFVLCHPATGTNGDSFRMSKVWASLHADLLELTDDGTARSAAIVTAISCQQPRLLPTPPPATPYGFEPVEWGAVQQTRGMRYLLTSEWTEAATSEIDPRRKRESLMFVGCNKQAQKAANKLGKQPGVTATICHC